MQHPRTWYVVADGGRARIVPKRDAQDAFDTLILVAPAHAHGALNHAVDAPTQRKIAARLQKDLTNVPNADLAKHFTNVGDA